MIRDGRTDYQGVMKCRKIRIGTIVQHDQIFKNVTIHSITGETWRIDVNRFDIVSLREFNGKTCYIQYIENGGVKMVCDIIKVERKAVAAGIPPSSIPS